MDRRQTQENAKEKVVSRPSSRISRLAQPRKYSATPHSLNRNRSSSNENVASYNRQINKRARSATPHIPSETPIRPPLARSLSSLFTPASTNKSTAPKKSDSEQAVRILDVLRKHFGPTFLPGGLQSMSAKQFVEIIRFFAQSIIGGRITIHDNNVDDVKRFVDLMEYPHQMNKSWFKAPTVSIAYERNVEFLDWLCDFLRNGGIDADNIEYIGAETDSLVDQQFVASFAGDLKNGFAIWSDETAEFDGWKLRWIREMIQTKTGLDDVDASIVRIQSEYEALQTTDVPFGNEHLLQTQLKKFDELGKEVAKMEAVCNEKNIDFQETSDELNILLSTNKELTSAFNEIKETINNQKISPDERLKLVCDHSHKTHLLQEKQTFVTTLLAISDGNQIKIARLQNQKTSRIFALNAIVQQLLRIGIEFGDLDINQLTFYESDTEQKIKEKLALFTQIKEMANTRRVDIHASVNETQSELKSISSELFVIEDQTAAHKKHVHSLEIRLQKLENEIAETQLKAELQQQQLQMKIDNTTETCEQLKLKIQNAEKMIQSLKVENKSIFEGITLKTDAMLKAKLERQARQEAAISDLEQIADELKDAVRHLT